MFCWRNEWIHPFESMWSIFEKFKFANQVNSIEILCEFGTERVKNLKVLDGSEIRNLYSMEGFDINLLTKAFTFNVIEHNTYSLETIVDVLKRKYFGYECFFHDTFVYCQICMSEGHHSLFHQFKLLRKCPFHMCELIYNCPNCKNKIRYMLLRDKELKPFMCICGHLLFRRSVGWINLWSTKRIINDPLLLEWLNHSNRGRRLYFYENKIWENIRGLEMCLEVLEKSYIAEESNRNLNTRINKVEYGWELNDKLYALVIDVFKSIDRHIKKSLKSEHKYCLNKTRKYFYNRNVEKNCECSVAYMTWRNTLLVADPKYWEYIHLGVRPTKFNHGFAIPFLMIHEQIDHFVDYWRMNKEIKTTKDVTALKWMIGRITGALLIAYWRVCQNAVIESRENKNTLGRDSLSKALLIQAPCIILHMYPRLVVHMYKIRVL
ncbi:hypothetical protein [Paenibacillus sp. V4I5]|uniref:hypothetical protein n=1 Tax=Paenibacillus sp. V4I5 TaxID=3042306 RepID=UPI00279245E5|nr:hypothetical protein [Paenibacillus sp. V4I5]MDQ0914663.1 hypothetical protein [Paenibacillus sp. V4I5]